MRVYIKGQSNPIDLTSKDFKGAGGEGTIYARNGMTFKIYHDPTKMIPVGKVQELSAITDPRVVRPEHVLLDAKGHPVGYCMRFIDDAWSLCQLFPPVFRNRNGLSHDAMYGLVRKLQEMVGNVHKAGILIVDLNEMNFLVAKRFDEIYGIDTDSYQTPHYPATAIMPSIRDWKTPLNHFTQDSDWFSFGIVSFQMFTGIHPYKGVHPKVNGLEERMKANISVFDKAVHIPAVVYPVDIIPKPFREWYKAVFADGRRCPPPSEFGGAILFVPTIKAVSGTAMFDITELGEFDGPIVHFWADDATTIVVTDKGVWVNSLRVMDAPAQVPACGFSSRVGRPVLVSGGSPIPTLQNLAEKAPVAFGLAVQEVSSTAGRLYCRSGDHIYEICLTDMGKGQVVASTKIAAQVLEHATRLYPGVAVQNLLGSAYLSLLTGSGEAHQVQVKELDKYRILDAKYEERVLMVVGEKGGKYDRLVFRFDPDDGYSYDVRYVKDISPSGINFAVLDTGVCVCLNEEEDIEVFSNRKSQSSTVKRLSDPMLGGDMILGKQAGHLIFARGNKLYRMKMKGGKP